MKPLHTALRPSGVPGFVRDHVGRIANDTGTLIDYDYVHRMAIGSVAVDDRLSIRSSVY